MILQGIIAALSLLGAINGARAAADCSAFTDPTTRLACYDAVAKTKSKPTPPKVTGAAAPDSRALKYEMLELRSKLDKAFLEAAMNLEVLAVSKGDRLTTAGKRPQLMIFGYMNRAAVYQIITKLDLVKLARDAGFQSLDMYGKSDGHWVFDLTGTGQTCARDLCF